jgi:glutamate-1-semialdehyde 2,1-aminomutase
LSPIERTFLKSAELLARSRRSLAGGVSSPFRAKAPIPLFISDALGSRLTDVDGNEFIDYSLAWGPLILGHRHPKLVATLREQAERPHVYGAQHELEFELAELVQTVVPCAERLAFTSSGSEAVQIGLRLARAATGRSLILKFEGHYHGWMDSVLLSYKPRREELETSAFSEPILGTKGQVQNSADNLLVIPWNDIASLREVFQEHGSQIAAVISEPVLCNSGCIEPGKGFLAQMASIAREHGALVIFDEVITGFRIAPGGAQSHYGVTPDIATLGKAMGGGLALSAIAGRQEILELMFTGGVSFGGTFNGNPLSLAAGVTTIQELVRDGGEPLRTANRTGEKLMEGIRQVGRRYELPLLVNGFGAAFAVHFSPLPQLKNYRDTLNDNGPLLAKFLMESCKEGINILPDGRFYVSTVHSEEDVEETLAAIDRVCSKLSADPMVRSHAQTEVPNRGAGSRHS